MDYNAIAISTQAAIKKDGAPISIRRAVPGVYDKVTGKTSAPTTTDYPGFALISGYKDYFVNGTSIKTGDKKFSIPAYLLGCVPSQTDKVIDSAGVAYTIVNVDPLSPGGVDILYKVQGRK